MRGKCSAHALVITLISNEGTMT